ncbi:LysR family transcriptional regulator [Pelagibius sp.]|uniref:LysR family transcriptional regulator n=1 Tax=Pelagibius sp. TaxID=1931238 RepID=UPI003BB09A8A
MIASFDIDALRAIVMATDLHSFASAAVQLGRSQSAISMQLKKLEQQVGTQLFVRKGRGLVPTEAGEALVAYARRIVALNDEAATTLGVAVSKATVRLGLPQDFFEDVMPATLTAFSRTHRDAHVEVQAGPNHLLADEVAAGRLDVAITLCKPRAGAQGELLCRLPMRWIAHRSHAKLVEEAPLPLVLFSHPCHFREAALTSLDRQRRRWRVAVTTPSLPGIWASLRTKLGIAVRTVHGLPKDMVCIHRDAGLPDLPQIELRMLQGSQTSAVARDLVAILKRETIALVGGG